MLLKKQVMSLVSNGHTESMSPEHAVDCKKRQHLASPYISKVNKIKKALAMDAEGELTLGQQQIPNHGQVQ